MYLPMPPSWLEVLCPFFNWIVCLPGVELCEFFMHFRVKPLSEVSCANVFSHVVDSSLPMFSLAMQKLFILMKSRLFLPFMSLALGDISVKILLHGISEIFLLMFSSRAFIVSILSGIISMVHCFKEILIAYNL